MTGEFSGYVNRMTSSFQISMNARCDHAIQMQHVWTYTDPIHVPAILGFLETWRVVRVSDPVI